MNKIILITILIFISGSIFSQVEETIDKKTQKKLLREANKEEKRKMQEQEMMIVKKMIEERQFVLEADYLSNGRGSRVHVSSSINFLIIDTTHCMIQIGSRYGIGYNGVGGITTEGKISEFNVLPNKKGNSFTIQVMTNTTLGNFDITFYIGSDRYADALITGITSGSLRYHGRIVSLKNSRVYKAHSF